MSNLTEEELLLTHFFNRNGCLRMPHEERFEEGSEVYKKGYEVRFVANDEDEIGQLLRLLEACGFKPGKPHHKRRRQTIIPVYGRDAAWKFDGLLRRGLEV